MGPPIPSESSPIDRPITIDQSKTFRFREGRELWHLVYDYSQENPYGQILADPTALLLAVTQGRDYGKGTIRETRPHCLRDN